MWTNIFTTIELLLIGFILFYQLKIGLQLFNRIGRYATYIPSGDYFHTKKLAISANLIENGDVQAIFEQIAQKEDHDIDTGEKLAINLINPQSSSGTHFDYIIESLNIYLLKNNGGIADFTIVKDLVERNVAVEDDDLKDSINKPLYLGLMATILGIIFGLFTMLLKMQTNAGDDVLDGTNQLELDDFLLSVCIAMVASFMGLAITTVTGLKFFKDAKLRVEQQKNAFYNFVQTELLPVVSQDFGSSIAKLSRSMHSFNSDFQLNMTALSGLFQRNYETLKVQDEVLDKLKHLNVQDFAKTNIAVLSRLEKATAEFDRFNFFMENLNTGLSETRALSANLTQLMNRVNNFEGIASRIDTRIEESNRVISFIESQFSDLEDMRSKYTTMLLRVDDSLEDTLDKFSEHIKDKRVGLVNLINEQHELLEKAYVENKTKFDKLDLLEKLDKLDLLAEMNDHTRAEKEEMLSSSNRLAKVAEEMLQSINMFTKVASEREHPGKAGENSNTVSLGRREYTDALQHLDTHKQNRRAIPPKKGFWHKLKRIFKR